MGARGDGDEPADGVPGTRPRRARRRPGRAGRRGHRSAGGDDTDGHLAQQRTPRARPPAA